MDITEITIKSEIGKLEKELQIYGDAAQNDLNQQKQVIQGLNTKLQEDFKTAQKEVDRRQGAIDQLKSMIEKPAVEKAPKKSKKNA